MDELIDIRSSLLDSVSKSDGGACVSIEEFKNTQFGLPLRHYAMQYLYGSTGLRFGALHSISGPPQSCKSPFVFDLMFDCCTSKENGGPEGMAFLYEMEGKLSPTLLASMAAYHDQSVGPQSPFQIKGNCSLDEASKHLLLKLLSNMRKLPPDKLPPVFVDWDSIGGASTADIVAKLNSEGTVGKGFHEKTHIMKNFCENWSKLSDMLPVVFMAVNQEKVDVQQTPGFSGPPKKHITGGESQIFKAGHIISAKYRQMSNAPGKIVTLKTTKTSFCDPRMIQVNFVWNQFGSKDTDAQGHHWQWAEAAVQLLAKPAIVGELRDIVDVKIGGDGSVTCKELGCTKVVPEDFEKALFDPGNDKVLKALYSYYKIEQIKGIEEFRQHLTQHGQSVAEAKQSAKDEVKKIREAVKAQAAAEEESKRARKEAKVLKNAKKVAAPPVAQPPAAGSLISEVGAEDEQK